MFAMNISNASAVQGALALQHIAEIENRTKPTITSAFKEWFKMSPDAQRKALDTHAQHLKGAQIYEQMFRVNAHQIKDNLMA